MSAKTVNDQIWSGTVVDSYWSLILIHFQVAFVSGYRIFDIIINRLWQEGMVTVNKDDVCKYWSQLERTNTDIYIGGQYCKSNSTVQYMY